MDQLIAESQTQVGVKKSIKGLERELIKSLAGKYGVSFKFAETFSPNPKYEFYDRHYSQANELAFIIEETEDKISIQHILFVGKRLIKHWRQDWVYENRVFWDLVSGHEWEKVVLSEEEVKGTWTQKVYQVDESPRYEGYGTWFHADGRHFWEGTADAALPRRDITIRDDYNVLRRNSHIEVYEDGSWLLEQDNEKIYRDADRVDTTICYEKGMERFTPKDYDITETMQWWDERKSFWADVRAIWESIREDTDHIKLENDMDLYMEQFGLAEKFSGENYDQQKVMAAVKGLLSQHLVGYTG